MNHDRLVWAAFSLVAALMIVSGLVVLGSFFLAPGSDAIAREMVEGRTVGRAIVLFLIIPAIVILCAQDKITGEAALATLSAIAGYILGGTAPR